MSNGVKHKTDYERLESLYEYLSALGYIADTYTCNKEIGECINAIREELKLTPCKVCGGLGYVTAISDAIKYIPCGGCNGPRK